MRADPKQRLLPVEKYPNFIIVAGQPPIPLVNPVRPMWPMPPSEFIDGIRQIVKGFALIMLWGLISAAIISMGVRWFPVY